MAWILYFCIAAGMKRARGAAASLPVHHGRPVPDVFLLPAASGTFLVKLIALYSVGHCAL
jgi:hypothetical protein